MPTVNEVHVGGFIDDAQNTSGSLSNVQIVGSTVDNELDINGEASNKIDTTGAIDIIKNLSGSLSNSQVLRSTLRNKLKISGQGSLPIVIDRTGIHYATTATWNAEPDLVGELGHLYIYSDHSKKEMELVSLIVYFTRLSINESWFCPEEKYLKAYLKQYKGYKYPNNISNVYPEFYY